jgi:hypothetical protein
MKQSIMEATLGAAPDGKTRSCKPPPGCPSVRYRRSVLADHWWLWALTGLVVIGAALGSGGYRRIAASARSRALARGLVEPGQGLRVETAAGGFWSDLSWVSLLLGAWVVASPWIWGYDDVHGAVATDVVTGSMVIVLTLAGVMLPPLNALTIPAGLWLVLSPWVIGYGNEGGPVGISDAVAGMLIAALGIAALASASRRIARGASMPAGRLRRPTGP